MGTLKFFLDESESDVLLPLRGEEPQQRVIMEPMEELGSSNIVEPRFAPEDVNLEWKKSVCPYCGVGCGILAGKKDNRVEKIVSDPSHPANHGLLCSKGVTLPQMLYTSDRLLYPQLRYFKQASLERVSWEQAFSHVTAQWHRIIKEHGPDAVAFYISGQLLTEDYYVVNKLAKGFLGTNNVDSNSRLCMASAVSGYVTSLGADAPPGCYADIEMSDCFLLIGTNTADCHPVTFERIRRRKQMASHRIKVIVVDPRKTRTADIADVYLPIQPGTDIALLNAMLHVLIRDGRINRKFIKEHTNDWDQVLAMAEKYPPETAAKICQIEAAKIEKAALAFGTAKAAMSFWSMGLNQSIHGTAKNNSVINLHLATGQIGRPGAGPFSLTGQPNAMGGRETGGLSHLLPGHRFIHKEQDRREAETLWGVSPRRISEKPGLAAVELFEALSQGKVKSVWIMATNPMVSMPNLKRTLEALQKAELVIVSDPYHPTETTLMADVILPVAQWSERDGTVTNSERAISYLEKVVEPEGEALPDWDIVCRFARSLGFTEAFDFNSAEAVYEEYKRFTVGRDLDISGVTYERLKKGPLQWPCPSVDHTPIRRRYTHGKFAHSDGKAKFIMHDYKDPAEQTDTEYPLILTTGRVAQHWHTLTRTGKIPALMKRGAEPFIELHPEDAGPLGIVEGGMVTVLSRRGKAKAKARVTQDIKTGTCFMPFHWGSLWGQAVVNQTTIETFDAQSKQPELKFCAVQIEKV